MKPKAGYKLRVVGGIIYHITGTNTYLSVILPGAAAQVDLMRIDNAVASASFVINDRVTTNLLHSVETTDFWIYGPAYLYFFGDATSGADIMVEEIELSKLELEESKKKL